MTDVETLLRHTFQAHEVDVPGVEGLAAAARRRADRQRRTVRRLRLSAVTVTALVAALLAVVMTSLLRPASTSQLPPVNGPVAQQVISSLGIELSVPATWTINQQPCGPTSLPTVIRDKLLSVTVGCVDTSQVTMVTIKPYVAADLVGMPSSTSGLPSAVPRRLSLSPATVNGLSGTMARGRLDDRRSYLVLAVPAIDVSVIAVGPAENTLRQVLATVHAVNVDNAGCRTQQPLEPSWRRSPTTPRVHLPAPASLSVCLYDGGRLAASSRLVGSAARAAVAAVNAAAAGLATAPDIRGCSKSGLGDGTMVWLHVLGAAGGEQDVRVHYLERGSCGPWFVQTSEGVSQLTKRILVTTVWPLDVISILYPGMPGYGAS